METQKAGQETFVINSILVIDDHPLYCDALVSTCDALFEATTVRSVNSLGEAMKVLGDQIYPDLVILDLKLPDVTGLSGFFKIKERLPDVPVLVISAESAPETIQVLMEVGAAGFIPKDAERHVIRKAVEQIQEGHKYLPAGFNISNAPLSADMISVQEASQRIADLTPQQGRIMALICAGKPNKQIAYELSLAEATVKAHITALLRRLGVRNRTQAAVLVNSANMDRDLGISDLDARALIG